MSSLRPVLFLSTLLLVGAIPLSAQVKTDELLNRLQPGGYVNDFAGLLTASQQSALAQMLSELERKTTSQIAVVTLRSLEGGEISDFSNRLFEKWGIGKKGKDNGVMVLVAIEDRKAWIETGYGLEPILPDARAGRILDEAVIPAFRRNNYAAGLIAGVQVIASIIAQDAGVRLTGAGSATPREGRPKKLSIFHILVAIVALLLFIRHPWLALFFLSSLGGRGGGGFRGGGFGGGFGGFGGGLSGGGGAGRSW